MSEFKGTKKVILDCTKQSIEQFPGHLPFRNNEGEIVLLLNHTSGEINVHEYNANAKLIEDAFIVRNQIEVDLPELLIQRNEMLEMLNNIIEATREAEKTNGHFVVSIKMLELILEKGEKLIKDATTI